MSMELSSDAFDPDGEIPSRFTCEGEDVSPALRWRNIPSGADSLVLIVDDPDAPDPRAPRMTYVHWLLYNLPPDAEAIVEATTPKELPEGTLQGRNDWNRAGYGGPCPPIGRHRYFFKLYALDTTLPDLGQPTKATLEARMQGHVIEQCELIGTYEKHG